MKQENNREKADMKWIDMHCDTLSELARLRKAGEGQGQTLMRNNLCVDMERLRQEDSAAQFFACYVNAREYEWDWDRAYHAVSEMAEMAQGELGGVPAGILTVEEGGVLNGDIGRLDELYEMGIRLVTLTWNYENCIGSPNSRDRNMMERGLTGFGTETVRRMNEMGMIIDVSHLSDGGFWDCIRHSRAPVAASHSNARGLCPHPRNLSDEMLRALGEQGGVAGLNFYSAFLKEEGRASAEDIALHAKYMIDKAGEDAVALGSDFDGFGAEALPCGISGVQDIGRIWEAMKQQGLTPGQIEKIAYKNVLRMIREV